MNKQNALLISRDPALARRIESVSETCLREVRRVAPHNDTVPQRMDESDIVLVDLRHNAEAGLTLAHQIKTRRIDTMVLVLHERKDPNALLQSLRFGLDDYIDLSEPDRALHEHVRKAVHRHDTGRNEGEAIGVFSLKGGQGVTTLALNLADATARLTGERVLLLDMHLDYSHAANYLDQAVDFTPSQLADDLERMDDILLSSSVTETDHGWHLLGVPPRQVSNPDVLVSDDIPPLMAFLKNHYRYILVDMPHHLSPVHASVLRMCERLLMPFRQDVQSVRALQTAVSFCLEMDMPEGTLLPVLAAAERQVAVREEDFDSILPIPVYHTIENSPQTFRDASELRAPLSKAAPDTGASRQIDELAAKLTNASIARPSTSWWAKLFRNG